MASAISSHPRDGALGVREARVFATRPQHLGRLGVAFHELTQRQVIFFDQFIYIGYLSHLEIYSWITDSAG
jgi:hypothetical protein